MELVVNDGAPGSRVLKSGSQRRKNYEERWLQWGLSWLSTITVVLMKVDAKHKQLAWLNFLEDKRGDGGIMVLGLAVADLMVSEAGYYDRFLLFRGLCLEG